MPGEQPEGTPMKHLIAVVALVLLTPLVVGCGNKTSGNKADDPRRHVEPAGSFSFVPPQDWEVRNVRGGKYKAAVGPAAAGFAPNINILDESFSGSLDAYVTLNLATLQKGFKKFRLVQQEDFKTMAGEQGSRVVTECEQNGTALRQTFYFFSKGDTKFVVTCTTLAEGGDKLDSVFETSMKTFRFDKK
jgi:hypothetical protein